ncbi:MAG: RluA family pseudouridine synthase [Henriciella sp.]|nr:RluA family pseudouridine synthase [Henriciella sp.]
MLRVAPAYRPPPACALTTVYLDDHVVVANKPSGLLSVPGLGESKAFCALSILTDRCGPVHTVHRLDMDTSGLIIFARSKAAQRHLSIQFQERQVHKLYEAVVAGLVQNNQGRIDAPIAKHSLQRPLRHIAADGQPAVTNWTVVSQSRSSTRLSLHPETGRSHQLRLHLKSIGHPILGDVFYGDASKAGRLLLHAKTISFQHPVSGTRVSLAVPSAF